MKRIKELNERKDTLILNEQRRMRTSYKEGEQPVPVDYDYKKTREEIAKIDAEVRAIRCGISLANCTVKLDDGLTIGEALVYLAQLNGENARLESLAVHEKLTRRITTNGVLEYTVCNYEPDEVISDREELRAKIYGLRDIIGAKSAPKQVIFPCGNYVGCKSRKYFEQKGCVQVIVFVQRQRYCFCPRTFFDKV